MMCPNEKCRAGDESLSVVRVLRNRTVDGKYSAHTDVRQMLCNPAKEGCGCVFYTLTSVIEEKTAKTNQLDLFGAQSG